MVAVIPAKQAVIATGETAGKAGMVKLPQQLGHSSPQSSFIAHV